METETLELEIRVTLQEEPSEEAQHRIRTGIEAELAEMFPGTALKVCVVAGSWELVVVLVWGAGIWVLERTLGEYLKKRAQLRAEADDCKPVSTGIRVPDNVDSLGPLFGRSRTPSSPPWSDFAEAISDCVSLGLRDPSSVEEPELVVERSVAMTVRNTKSGQERSYIYTVSVDSESLTIKNPRR